MEPRASARRLAARVLLALTLASATTSANAANRHWQTGTWRDVQTHRRMVDFGPGATSFDGRPSAPPQMRAMADIHTFVIESDSLHLECEDVVPVGRHSLEVVAGTPVTFAIAKNTVYVRDADGKERKLRLTKKLDR